MLINKQYLKLFGLGLLLGCSSNSEVQQEPVTTEQTTLDTPVEEVVIAEVTPLEEDKPSTIHPWKNVNAAYTHFNWVDLDTVYIGPTREITSVRDYFTEERSNVMVLIDEGEYIYDSEVWIRGENVIIKGNGDVSILCSKLYNCVMWVSSGNNIVIDNLHLMHLMPGSGESQNCSGRVIGFDGADNVTIVNCDLNGCGLAGLHDNLGNGRIYAEYNYIHNNSLGAYTDIDGNVWQEEIDDHETFVFKNNLIKNNGADRIIEDESYFDEENEDDFEH